MKTKLAAAIFAATMLPLGVNAAPIFLDVGANFDGGLVDADSTTGSFNSFILNEFSPTSLYFDTDFSGTVTTGDLVVDAAQTTINSLSPSVGSNSEFLAFDGLGWNLDVEWVLIGAAIETPDGVVGAFFDGEVTFDFVNLTGGATPSVYDGERVITIDVTSGGPETGDNFSINLAGEVTQASEGFATIAGGQFLGQDMNDLVLNTEVDVFARANTDLLEIGDPEALADGTTIADVFGATLGASIFASLDAAAVGTPYAAFIGQWDALAKFSRTTLIESANLGFEVPAPATLGLLGLGLLGLGARARKQRA